MALKCVLRETFDFWLPSVAHRRLCFKFPITSLKHLKPIRDFCVNTHTPTSLLSILAIIIQQIVTMPIYGKEALNICHLYMTDILRYT